MRTRIRFLSCFIVMCGIATVPLLVSAETQTPKKDAKPKRDKAATVSETKLPDKVRKTFLDKFPNATISKADAEKEGGVEVWDIEFRDGRTQKETDIAADGTMLEYTVYVSKKSVPKDALKRMDAAAKEKDAKMGHIEKIELSYETKDGKVIKLDRPKTTYAVEMTKGDQTAEIVVDEKGKVIEEPKWDAPKNASKKPGG